MNNIPDNTEDNSISVFNYEYEKYRKLYYTTNEFLQHIDDPEFKTILHSNFADEAGVFCCTWNVACRSIMSMKFPSDWLQAFKLRWFPAWLLARYPVIYTDVLIKEIAGVKRNVGIPVSYNITIKNQHSYGLEL